MSAEEDLEKIPMLTREDIPAEIVPLVNQEMTLAGVPVVFHEIETNGIGYLNLMFDLAGVPEELLPYVTLLENTLGMIDTVHYDYGELYNEINVHTGGIETTTEVYPDVTKVREKAYRAFLEIRARALYDQIPFAIQMMQEMILGSKLDDENRLREILDMTMAQQQMKFMSEGHSIASVRAMSYSSPIARFRDMTSGIEFDEFTGALLADFDTEKENIIRKLQMLGRLLFRKGNMLISYTASAEGLRELETAISGLNEALYPEQEITDRAMLSLLKKNEGFKSSSQVQYVAQAGNFADAGFEYSGVLQVLKVIMGFDYLWLNIRMKGGAYGCAGSFNRIGESFFVSYRDPNLANTLAVYADIPEYLRRFDAGERDMTKYIIGTISNLDQPLSPSLQGERSMTFYLNHVSEAMLRKEREEILSASAEDIRALAKLTEAVLAADQICVIGNETEIEECRKLFMNVEQLF